MPKSKSKIELFKEESHFLRGAIAGELQTESTHFNEAGKQVLKFHGLYQQDDRDKRLALRRQKKEKLYSFMIRSKIPAGQLTADQYLVHDDLATRYANGTLRITTRQCFQLHGVLKGDLKPTLRDINRSLITTLGACGDLVRNVMCCPVPSTDPIWAEVLAITHQLSDHLLPQTKAYHETWLDGEKVYSGREQAAVEEPIYGPAYLPRKFKIGVAFPGDNCVDIYTQDVGLVAVIEADRLQGFNILVGGGMGMTHKKPETFPRLADPLAFVRPDRVVPVVEQIVRVQRDYGDRANRKHARLKYLIHDWGLDRFQAELEQRLGYRLEAPAPVPAFDLDLHLGWHPQGDGRWYLGLSVENGRIQDVDGLRLKTGLRTIIETFRPGVRLTPNHDILLTGLRQEQKEEVEGLLRAHGIRREESISNAQLYSMACPALPTCGLALAESERALPQVIDRLEAELRRLDLQEERLSIRMTGCPNGCARPYVADLAFVGRSADRYVVYVGGRIDGTRLNQIYRDMVPGDELVDAILPLLVCFKQARTPGESFGDFCARVGIEALRAYAERPRPNGANGHLEPAPVQGDLQIREMTPGLVERKSS